MEQSSAGLGEHDRTVWGRLKHHLNFFRLHILVFTFTPIIAACIFYAANGSAGGNANSAQTGRQKVTFIDSLFVCFSAMTTCGLVTVNLSALHPFQQVLLFLLFIIGDPTFVSLIMVLIRKRYFRTHCEQLLLNDRLRRTKTIYPDPADNKKGKKIRGLKGSLGAKGKKKAIWISGPLEGHRIEGFVEERDQEFTHPQEDQAGGRPGVTDSPVEMTVEESRQATMDHSQPSTIGRGGRSTALLIPGSPDQSTRGFTTAVATPTTYHAQSPVPTRTHAYPHAHVEPTFQARQRIRAQTRAQTLARTTSINLASLQRPHNSSSFTTHPGNTCIQRTGTTGIALYHPTSSPVLLTHTQTQRSSPPKAVPHPTGHKNTGYGGFPTPLEIIRDLMPQKAKSKLAHPVRKLELITHPTYAPSPDAQRHAGHEESWAEAIKGSVAKWMPEGLGGLVVGRNSRFWTEELDDEELEQIGGVEYRGLRLLSYLVSGYIILCQVIPFAIIAIYFAKVHKWDSAFQPSTGVQTAAVNKTWFSLYVVVSAYTGTGMSLIDQGLSPFATCYLLIYVLVFVLLAGNHALPIMLRFVIWLGTKITRRGERFETLHFLLDHPRRCFLYLFPSHQTWYLVFILLAFVVIELFGFLVLNIGLPVLDSLNGWQRFSDGMLQSLSVRASGFGVLAIANMAPSVLFLYVILMYVAIYPIAMSVRSTNVYEERALGVYEHEDPDTLSEDEPQFKGRRPEVFSKYLLWHMRKQLAFDVWPLTLAIFVICCFERGKLLDNDKAVWFNIFRILFECTSAYSVIGLSLGTPNNNFSFSGEFGTASKIVIILVMLRGRHRGLPVAIDRAILLPKEYARIVKPTENGVDNPQNQNQNQGQTHNGGGTDYTEQDQMNAEKSTDRGQSHSQAQTKAHNNVNPFASVSMDDDRARPIEYELEKPFRRHQAQAGTDGQHV
ncbi:potassium ion transporter [Kwoniella heveanensis CBS 569]|nr:potassium ion transporter [Kwoniella heveanensis CBS 569]